MLFGQHGTELTDDLLQHPGQVGGAAVQFDVRKVKAGNIKKFVDQIFQPFGFVQRNASITGTQFRRNLGLITKEGQVSDDAGQRCFQVVGQVDDQIVFALFGFPGKVGVVLYLLAGNAQGSRTAGARTSGS